MAQATSDIHTTEDPKEAAKRRAKLTVEAIACYDAHASDGQEPTSSFDSLTSASAAYLSDVATRSGVICMVYDIDILMAGQTGINPI